MENRKRIKEEPNEDELDKTSKRIKEEPVYNVAKKGNVFNVNKVKMENHENKVKNEIKEEGRNQAQDHNKTVFAASDYDRILVQNLPKWQKLAKMDQSDMQKSLYTDLMIHSNDNNCFAVHANIVMAVSKRLREALCGKDETNLKEIALEDVSGEELTWMLYYIYEGRATLKTAEQGKRLRQLINHFGLIDTDSSDAILPNQDTKDDSFIKAVRKGGIMRMGKGGQCIECGRNFKTFHGAKIHYEVKHTSPDPSEFKCPICGKENSHHYYLEQHLGKKHGLKKSQIMTDKKNND